jgi:C4-dicarboxylate-specific signal transduction histidine kinase/ActR/RegA family two-component response regulator
LAGWAVDTWYLPIQDEASYGLVIAAERAQLTGFRPGDLVTATGVISRRAGMPVLKPATITRESWGAPPQPRVIALSDLVGFRYIGVLVTTEGRVTFAGTNTGGEMLTLAERDSGLTVFLPKRRVENPASFASFSIGDRARVTGISTQYCPLPPYTRAFQIIIPSEGMVTLVEHGALVPPFLLLIAAVGIALILVVWWIREHRLRAQRQTMRTLNSLTEEIVAASSPGEILVKLAHAIPEVSGATGVRLYIVNRKMRTLDRVTNSTEPDPLSVSVDAPIGPLPTGAALCYRNRTLLNIPDTRRSPFFKASSKADLPRSVMFVPMMAQSEAMGVLELYNADRVSYFSHEEQTAAQHLANQVATSLRLQEQHSIREQLFRSEKLAATGQLISGIANQLRAPLEMILAISRTLLAEPPAGGAERQTRVLAAEAQRASEIVARLVSFGRAEDAEPKLVEVNSIISSLQRFRDREWKSLGIDVRSRLSHDPLHTLGAQGQLEQVFLNLLVHAEQSVIESPDKVITIETSAIGRRVLIEISYSGPERPSEAAAPDNGFGSNELGIGVARGIIQSHGGEMRLSTPGPRVQRFEVELPLAGDPHATKPRRAPRTRQLTALVVEPDAALQRGLVAELSERDYRVVPVATAEEGMDLSQRLRFDVVLCSVRLPGLNWVEFSERVREHISVFVLMTDGYDVDLARAFRSGEGLVLSKPVQPADLERVLTEAEARIDSTAGAGNR